MAAIVTPWSRSRRSWTSSPGSVGGGAPKTVCTPARKVAESAGGQPGPRYLARRLHVGGWGGQHQGRCAALQHEARRLQRRWQRGPALGEELEPWLAAGMGEDRHQALDRRLPAGRLGHGERAVAVERLGPGPEIDAEGPGIVDGAAAAEAAMRLPLQPLQEGQVGRQGSITLQY